MRKLQPKTLDQKPLFNLLKGNSPLAAFAKEFYELLSIVSPDRKVNPRKKHERRLESIARLLAGDEVCTAVVFDEQHLLVASNQTDHKEEAYQIEFQFIIQPGSSYNNGFQMRMRYQFFQHNESGVEMLCEKDGEIIHYDYNKSTDTLIPQTRELKPAFTFAEHQVPGLPDVGFPGELDDIPNASGEFFDSIAKTLETNKPDSWQSFVAPFPIDIRAPFPVTKIDPLTRRTEILVEYLGFVVLGEDTPTSEKDQWRKMVHQNRARVLKNSLSWEIARWPSMKKLNIKMRQFDKKCAALVNEVNEFIETLSVLFTTEIKLRYSELTLEEQLDKWQQIALQRINIGSLSQPKVISTKELNRFLKRMKLYLQDLEKLESYIIQMSTSENSTTLELQLALLLSEQKPLKPKTLPKIIDDCEDKVHAEVRILYHYLRQKKLFPDYIAISKLCCAHCGFTMHQLGIDTLSGVHGKAYPNWKIPTELFTDKFLKLLLGDHLFEKFQLFSHELQESALSIIQSIACLSEEELKSLGISDKKLWNAKSEYAYESEDEASSEEEDKESSSTALSIKGGIYHDPTSKEESELTEVVEDELEEKTNLDI